MSSVETYYLIDFENVNDDGLSGSNTLGPNDHVHLFYTENAKISLLAKIPTMTISLLFGRN